MSRKHDDHAAAVAVALAARQESFRTAANETDRKNAMVTYYRAVLVSGKAQGISTNAKAALARLGVDEQTLDGNI